MSSALHYPVGVLLHTICRSAWQWVSMKMTSHEVGSNKIKALYDLRIEKASALYDVMHDDTDKLSPAILHLQELIAVEEECENLHNFTKKYNCMVILGQLQGIVWHYTDSELSKDFAVLNRLCRLRELVERLTSLWLRLNVRNLIKTIGLENASLFNSSVITLEDIFATNPGYRVDLVGFIRSDESLRTARSSIEEAIEEAIGKAEVHLYKLQKLPLQLYPRIANVARLCELNPMNFTECSICLAAISIKENNIAVLENCAHVFCAPCIREWINNKSSCPVCRVSCHSAISRDDFLAFRAQEIQFCTPGDKCKTSSDS